MDPFQKDDKSYLGNLDYISRRNSVCDSGVPGKSSEYADDHRTMVITVFTEIGAQEPLVV